MIETFRSLVALVQRSDDEPDLRLVPVLYAIAEIPEGDSAEADRIAAVIQTSGPLQDWLSGMAGSAGQAERPMRANEEQAEYLLLQFANPASVIRMLALGEPPELPRLRDLALDPAVGPRQKVQLALALHPAAGSILSHALWGGQHPDAVGRFYLRQSPHSATGQAEVIDQRSNMIALCCADEGEGQEVCQALNSSDGLGDLLASSYAYKNKVSDPMILTAVNRVHADIVDIVMAECSNIKNKN